MVLFYLIFGPIVYCDPCGGIIMKVLERNKAIKLRRQGKTFREIIREVVPVSKGSLSCWLRGIELNSNQLRRIEYKNNTGR